MDSITRRARGLYVLTVMLVALATATGTVLVSGAVGQGAPAAAAQPETTPPEPTEPSAVQPELSITEQGSLRDLVAPEDRAEFDEFMAQPGSEELFVQAFQEGIDQAQGKKAGATNVLAYGFDRNHVWVTASYADMARGLVWGAVQYCKRYVPAPICQAAGNWLTGLARGYAPMNNHGVWGALYVNRYTGGRW